MSVSLREVINFGGYNLDTVDDAQWLISKQAEFERLVEEAEAVIEASEEEHSRHDPDHYEHCERCRNDHEDFMQEQAMEMQSDLDQAEANAVFEEGEE